MRRPDFIIAGTQKAGTTWVRDNLYAHPCISGADHQIHFFDRHYEKGVSWYCRHFDGLDSYEVVGEKTTEYFDISTASEIAPCLARCCPETKVIVILREPAARAFSALHHMVVSGLEPLPENPDALLFADRERPPEKSYRYIERGFYARQLEAFYRHIPPERLLVLIFEEDILANPEDGMRRTFAFLHVDPEAVQIDTRPVNARRLSRPGVRLMHMFRSVPYARSLIWRLDICSPFTRWKPTFSDETKLALREIFTPENEMLYEMLDRRIPEWDET